MRFLKRLPFIPLLILVAFLLWGILRPAVGQPHAGMSFVPKETVEALLLETEDINKLPHPSRPTPAVLMVSHEEFVASRCPDNPTKCPAIAIYTDYYNMIIMDESYVDLSTVPGRGILVHELTHFLRQTPTEKYATVDGCTAEEGAAYAAQAEYLKRHNDEKDVLRLLSHLDIYISCLKSFGDK